MTNQEAYNKVCAHLAKQGRRSEDKGRCLYRGPGGLMCAVGCLIPDELYHGDMEGDMMSVLTKYPDVAKHFDGVSKLLLHDLQGSHDFSSTRDEIVDRLLTVAHEYDLTPGAEQAITDWQ